MSPESGSPNPEGLRSQEYTEFIEQHICDGAISPIEQRVFSEDSFKYRFGRVFLVEDPEATVREADLSDINTLSNYYTERYFPRLAIDQATMCEEHFVKAAPLDLNESAALPAFEAFEIDVSCCAECEKMRIKVWGRPDDEYIKYFAVGFLNVKNENPERYEYTIQEFRLFAYAELTDEKEGIAERVLSQVEECAQTQFADDEDDRTPYWTAEDYESLLKVLGE